MTICYVYSEQAGYNKEFYSVTDAKKEMKRLIREGYTDVRGNKTKVWSNGDWENCGEITLTGSNATFMANSPRNMKHSNY